MMHLVFFVEELSAKEFIDKLIPRISTEVTFKTIPFNGKQDLEKNLFKKMKYYLVPNSYFFVVRDQDSGDCIKIKQNLSDICRESGKQDYIVRIACRELESWYLADLSAVESALDIKGIAKLQNKSQYRQPDNLENPSKELETLTKGQYQKVSGSRKIADFIDLNNNRSKSFYHFVQAVRRISTAS